jgi:TolA-binding protein
LQDKAERTFRDKREKIDEFVGQPTQFSDRNTAFYDYLNFLHDIDIEDINELLNNEIQYYLNVYTEGIKNLDQILFWQGELYEKAKDWEEAVSAYTKLKYMTPESPLLAHTMFKIAYLQYKETGQYQQAKENFSDILTTYAESSFAGDAQFYLAEMYEEELDNRTESIANYRLLVENFPKHRYAVESLKRVAEMLVKDDKYEDAINSYYQIFELYPEHTFAPEALLEIEELYRRKLKNYIKAVETLKLYATQYATREDAAERLFDAADLQQDELKDNQAAIETYNEVITKFPESKYAKRANDRIADLNEE